jgi:trypsin
MRSVTQSNLLMGLATTLALVGCGASEQPVAPAEDADDAIIGGSMVPSQLYPWMVAVHFEDGQGGWYQGCGGALIDSTHVLTAAHCSIEYNHRPDKHHFVVRSARPNTIRVAMRPNSLAALAPDELLRVRKVSVHPSYDDLSLDFDVAVYELARPVVLASYPTLADVAQTRRWVATQAPVKALGYGTIDVESGETSDYLRQVVVPLVSDAECAADYAGTDYLINGNTICAAPDAGGRDACYGDSGGPLFRSVGGQPVLVGVVSTGEGCAQADYPGIYARVSSVRDYIRACQAGSCENLTPGQFVCQLGWEDCDGNTRNGCERFVGGASECGACGAPACAGDDQCTFDANYALACTSAQPIVPEFLCTIAAEAGPYAHFQAHNPNARGQIIPAGPHNRFVGATDQVAEYFYPGDVSAYARLSGEPVAWLLRDQVADVPADAASCSAVSSSTDDARARALPRPAWRARFVD